MTQVTDRLIAELRETYPLATPRQISKIAALMLRLEYEFRELGAEISFLIVPDHDGFAGSA